MLKLRGRGVNAILFLATLALLINFFVLATPGKSDGVGGWPIVQCDTTGDSSLNSSAQEEPRDAEESLDFSTLIWLIITSV